MPKQYEMSYEGAPKYRWVKMYKGVRYRVTCEELKAMMWTKEGSYKLANDWWRKKRAEIDGAEAIPGVADPVRRTLEAYSGEPIADKPAVQRVAGRLASEFVSLPLERMEAIVGALKGTADPSQVRPEPRQHAREVPSVGETVERWLNAELTRQKAGRVSGSRASMNRVCLNHFRDWIGEDTPVDRINGLLWQDWHTFLSEQLHCEKWGEAHVDRIFAVARRFVRSLWEWELIELPRNLDSTKLSFTVSPQTIKVLSDYDLAALHGALKGQSVLHFRLMLNCGFTAKDCNDLRHDEVDWEAGIITRKRSKTARHGNVPVVRYKLWAETFDLLKQHRSEDAEIVLLTHTGKRWIQTAEPGPNWHRSDSIRSCFRNAMKAAGVNGSVKQLRATAATKLGSHRDYKSYAPYFLGHSPRTVADKHYVVPHEEEFFAALAWLETALGLKDAQDGR